MGLEYDHMRAPFRYRLFFSVRVFGRRKINGIEMVPSGHRLTVCKTVPFGTLFWSPFANFMGTDSALLVGGTLPFKGTVLVPFFLLKRAPFFKTVPQGHCFGSLFFLSAGSKVYLRQNFTRV